ncbi:hypothetical protein [Peribacillus sp. FSL E2-0218]|uniref:hypothetical protein n=1 Tax=Peribacillus sp. FSL E2-0218 TaxID=2921364 RepID=UPI0030EEEB3A
MIATGAPSGPVSMLDVVLEKNRLYPSFANPAATGKPELEKLANFLITGYIDQGKTGRCWEGFNPARPSHSQGCM